MNEGQLLSARSPEVLQNQKSSPTLCVELSHFCRSRKPQLRQACQIRLKINISSAIDILFIVIN